jgi:5-methylcytosine-specific restriction endonuclease McrA
MFEITNLEFAKLVAESKNWTDLARRCCGERFNNGGMNHYKKILRQKVLVLGLDTSHFSKIGQWNIGRMRISWNKKSNAEVFVESRINVGHNIKDRLFKMGWKNECATCKNVHFVDQDGILLWQGKQLKLQIEHRNGVHSDNRIENLELICQLCHAQTSTYTGRNLTKVRGKPSPTREAVDDDELTKRVRECRSWTKICTYGDCKFHQLYANEFRRRATKLGLDVSHFEDRGRRIPDADYFVIDTNRSGENIKQRLFDLGWKNECAGCKNVCFVDIRGIPHWMGKETVLHIEHKNGVHSDNRLQNLELLCYACHSQTSTYTGKNTKKCIAKRKWVSDVDVTSVVDKDCGTRRVREKTADV